MADNTMKRIDPAMDKYSITRRSNMSEHLSTDWPEKRENFLMRGSSNVNIYVPMDRTYGTIRKSKSADITTRIPRAAVLLTLVMMTLTLGETQAITYTKHLNNIEGPPH